MKRITYISVVSEHFFPSDIITIGEKSQENNNRDGLSGVLFCFKDVFYQILEGDESKVDECFNRISKDNRHKDIFVLETRNDIQAPEYPDWSMRTVRLDQETESLILPLRNMLDTITQTYFTLRKFTSAEVLNDIQRGINPMERTFQTRQKVVLFSDIFRSTTLAEVAPLEAFSKLLDTYYAIVIESIVEFGGTVSNLMGDGIMAYFDASNALNSVNACLSALLKLKKMRDEAKDLGKYLYAGFGLCMGDALEGSIGSDLYKNYTLIGNTVNTASRYEHITRRLRYSLVFGKNMSEQVSKVLPIKKVGDYTPKGTEAKSEIFTVDVPQTEVNALQVLEHINSFRSK